MENNILDLLSSANNIVEKKTEIKSQQKEKIINGFYGRIKKRGDELNKYIANQIIDAYIKRRKDEVESFFKGDSWIPRDEFTFNFRFNDIGTCRYLRNSKFESEKDRDALNLINKHFNISNGVYVGWGKDGKYTPYFFNEPTFGIIQFKFHENIYDGDPYIYSDCDFPRVEAFVNAALCDILPNGFKLDCEVLAKYKEDIKNLEEAEKFAIKYRTKSINNANYLVLNVCKELINQYKRTKLSPTKLTRLSTTYQVIEEPDVSSIFAHDDFTQDDLETYNRLKPYLSRFYHSEPNFILVNVKNGENDNYLPMLENDLGRAINELNIDYRIYDENNGIIDFHITDDDFEYLVSKCFKEKEEMSERNGK